MPGTLGKVSSASVPPVLPLHPRHQSGTAVFGGSFNPPGRHHRQIATTLLAGFDQVLVVPCGYRADKAEAVGGDLAWLNQSVRRQAIAANFAGLPGLEIDWSDLAEPSFTPTIELARRYAHRGELWFVAGADLFAGGATASSQIQLSWKAGPLIWQELSWVCLTRPGITIVPADLPPRHRLVEVEISGSSSEIRRRLARGQDIRDLVTAEVAQCLGQL